MPLIYSIRLSRTLPNLPIVEEDVEAESVDSTGGGAPLYPPAPPPPSPNPAFRDLEEFGITVPRQRNPSSVSSGTTLVADAAHRSLSSPIRNNHGDNDMDGAIGDHHGHRHEDDGFNELRDHFAAQMATPLDPTTASFEPTGARFAQPPNRFSGGAHQLNHNHQNGNGGPMVVAQNGHVNGNGMQMQDQMYQQQPQFAGNANFVVAQQAQQPEAMQHTFPQQPDAIQHTFPQQPEAMQHTFPQQPDAIQHTFPQQPEAMQHTFPQQPDAMQHTFPVQQPDAMQHTFPAQLPTANMHHQQSQQQLMPTFPQGGPAYQPAPQQQQQQQHTFPVLAAQNENGGYTVQPQGLTTQPPQQQQPLTGGGMQTPGRHGEGSSAGRFTPGTYRFTPTQGSNASSETTRSPASAVITGYPPSTEPRSFAPRTNGLAPREPPPRFALQVAPAPAQQQQQQTVTHPQYSAPVEAVVQNQVHQLDDGGGRVGPSQQEQQQQQQHQHGAALQHTFPSSQVITSNFDNVDPFRTVELSSVIQPIEPVSNALVVQVHPVPEYVRNQRSKELNELTAGPKALPTIEMALHPDYFPFMEGPRNAQPCPTWGVVKIKNIPFSARRAEIIAFLGRNSRVLNDRQEPVHIIMERVTSKTNDCYVEFMSMQDAVHAVEKHNRFISSGRQNRLGDRPVELELSSQAALMKDLFPHANGIRWEGARPVVLEDHPTEPWNRFKGFITDEEMICLVKHVEVPQRSPFSRDCPQRPYECMISTLRKLPWYMAEHITIRQRHAVHKALLGLLNRLKADLNAGKHQEHLNDQLYKRLWTSALLCDGLSVCQKDDVAYTVGLSEEQMRGFNMPRLANHWSHQWTMAPKPGSPLDVIEWFIAIIREETERTLCMSLPNVQAAIRNDNKQPLYWGWLFKELDLPRGPPFDNMTLAEMATREFTAVTAILRRAFAQ